MKPFNPLVTIACITYNHKGYIKSALESFLNQKTNFDFEIIVHDDASTDGTTEIILEFQKKYPEVIRCIIQDENQYSKGLRQFVSRFIHPHARGQYVATCEGDDFWIDEFKLQKQVDLMRKYPDLSMVCHATKILDEQNRELNQSIKPFETSKFFSVEDVILLGPRIHTSSKLCTKEVFDNKSTWRESTKSCHLASLLNIMSYGKAYYINQEMSAYRIFTPGSWTSRVYKNKSTRVSTYNGLIETLDAFNFFTSGKHVNAIEFKQKYYEIAKMKYKLRYLKFVLLFNPIVYRYINSHYFTTNKLKFLLSIAFPRLEKLSLK